MKLTFKNVAVVTAVLIVTLVVLSSVTYLPSGSINQTKPMLKVNVVDLDGNPVHNATVSVIGTDIAFNTDNKGVSPLMELPVTTNLYDPNVTSWYCVNLRIAKGGFVDTFVFNCVVYQDSLRTLTVKIYPQDASNLPYVCYVESPPNQYLDGLISQNAK